MRLLSWLRHRSNTRVDGKVTITLDVDSSAYVAGMKDAASIIRYHRAVAHERDLGRAYVGVVLDELARSVGLDPVQAWRLPRARAERLEDLHHPDVVRRQAAEAAWLAEHREQRAQVVCAECGQPRHGHAWSGAIPARECRHA